MQEGKNKHLWVIGIAVIAVVVIFGFAVQKSTTRYLGENSSDFNLAQPKHTSQDYDGSPVEIPAILVSGTYEGLDETDPNNPKIEMTVNGKRKFFRLAFGKGNPILKQIKGSPNPPPTSIENGDGIQILVAYDDPAAVRKTAIGDEYKSKPRDGTTTVNNKPADSR